MLAKMAIKRGQIVKSFRIHKSKGKTWFILLAMCPAFIVIGCNKSKPPSKPETPTVSRPAQPSRAISPPAPGVPAPREAHKAATALEASLAKERTAPPGKKPVGATQPVSSAKTAESSEPTTPVTQNAAQTKTESEVSPVKEKAPPPKKEPDTASQSQKTTSEPVVVFKTKFDDWEEGAPPPPGIELPLDKQYMRIVHVKRRELRNGNVVVYQRWNKPYDSHIPLEQKFGVVVNNLLPDTDYLLEVEAATPRKTSADIRVYGYKTDLSELSVLKPRLVRKGDSSSGVDVYEYAPDTSVPFVLERKLIRVGGEKSRDIYTGTFNSGDTSQVKFAVSKNRYTKIPGDIIWYSWKLTEISE